MLAHFYTIQSQLASDFLLHIAPPENILEVAFTTESVETNRTIYWLSEIFFAQYNMKKNGF